MTYPFFIKRDLHTSKINAQLRLAPASLVLTGFALLAGGCAVGPDYHAAEAPKVSAYTNRPLSKTNETNSAGGAAQQFMQDKEVAAQWWHSFGSAEIDRLVDAALAHNPSIASAQAALRQAKANADAQRGSYFPTVQASYTPNRQRNAVGTISPTLTSGDPVYTLHTAQLSISYVPDVFGLNRRTVESLVAQEESQHFQLEATYLTLAANVVTNAIQLSLIQAQIKSNEEIIAAAEKTLTMLTQQAKLGFSSGLDISAQETALAQARLALPPLQKQLDQTKDMLAVLCGEFPSDSQIADIDLATLTLPQELPLSLPSSLIQQRPDVRAAEALVHAASAQVGVAIANRLPQFSISGNLGGTSTGFSHMFSAGNQFWSVAGGATQTLLDFGTLKHKQTAAEAALDQATAQYRSVVLTAFQNVADSLFAIDADAKALQAAVDAEKSAKKTADLTKHQFESGFVGMQPVLAAEQAYQQAKLTRLQNQAARYTDSAALFQALGGGWWNRKI
ncbi:efflux transporter outer membrane subunit [Undibacterium oligocarboniphilum]|uniref:Efflux transporter outer membrane subunit n=1 Tax=Undibacterium oligocarboniphilum TaxID=666702 RepID=A0A850QK38_9BURK|nr:efflux transporter outer membrane subunit [Undibacterium oligocarboniphilum]MBC3871931.1 efflux transporter outer membrane subunit [Undibacterium oligocarboniphilum]NVO79507.1 efflux transporter outer membrane subunit [Undibacterium oligocarboniphilum]